MLLFQYMKKLYNNKEEEISMKKDEMQGVENKTVVGCGPGCDCGKPKNNKKTKMIVTIIVLALAGSLLGYKLIQSNTADAHNTDSNDAPSVLSVSSEIQDSASGSNNVSNQGVMDAPMQKDTVDQSVQKQNGIGQSISSFDSLNDMAVNQDAVFVFIPATSDTAVNPTTVAAVSGAEQTLQSNGIHVGLYTLQTNAPEYTNIASQASLPGVLVAKKGGSMTIVTGDVTESKLVQAFVACSRSGGCGSGSSCGSGGCN